MRWLFLVILSFSFFCSAQDQNKIDSLKRVIKNANHDTTVVSALLDWSTIVAGPNPAKDHEINLSIDSICKANLQNELSTSEEK